MNGRPPRRLYTPARLARLFSVTTKSINLWVREKRIPVACRTVGGHARFDADLFDAYVAGTVTRAQLAEMARAQDSDREAA